MTAPALMVAAPGSGSGKTTVTLALLAALRRRGLRVAAAKTGPDYIDPGFHAAATGRPGTNLDAWAMPPALLDALLAEAARDADLLVVESAMGLFDGVDHPDGAIHGTAGTPAELAARFALPVLLVLPVNGQAQSAAATARGFATHHPSVRVAGVVLNRVASERHRAAAARALGLAGLPVLGALPRDAVPPLPERHLGLVQAGEHPDLLARLDALADAAEAHLDLDAVLALARPPCLSGHAAASPEPLSATAATPRPFGALPPPGRRIALARDAAFTFAYPHLLAGWRAAGAAVHPFSPLADEPPPDACDCCWLPGGYPELHGPALAAATRFRDGLAAFAATRPVHGECGGFMVLGRFLEDANGVRHRMTGLLDHATSLRPRRMTLGYREATLLAPGGLGPAGTVLRGHEFHYAHPCGESTDPPLATLRDGAGRTLGPAGARRGHVTGGFFHAIAVW